MYYVAFNANKGYWVINDAVTHRTLYTVSSRQGAKDKLKKLLGE